MALVRINERTVVQKIKVFIIGDVKPKLITRIAVVLGFAVWLYFTIWQSLILLSILLVNRLQNPQMITDTFNRIGSKYGFINRWGLDTNNTLIVYSIVLLALFAVNLLGLIMIYRKNKLGYLIYLLTNGLAIAFTIIFLGTDYFNEQITMIDKITFISITAFFLLGFFIFNTTTKRKLKKQDLESNN